MPNTVLIMLFFTEKKQMGCVKGEKKLHYLLEGR